MPRTRERTDRQVEEPDKAHFATPENQALEFVQQNQGQSLEESAREIIEPKFAHNFADIRIFADGQAPNLANKLDARAFTIGQNIVFGENQYQPHLRDGQGLLAHELAHTMQQRNVDTKSVKNLEIADRNSGIETEARAASAGVMQGQSVQVGSSSSAMIAREPKGSASPIKPDKYTAREDWAAKRRYQEAQDRWAMQDKLKGAASQDENKDGIVDHVIDDAGERAKSFAAYGLSEKSKPYEADTPETEFLADLKSGVDQVASVCDYVDKALKYWEKFGKWINIGQQLTDLNNISTALNKNLGKVSKTINKAREVVAFIQGVDELADNWSAFDPRNPSTHQAFIKSLKKFGVKAEPFFNWAKEKLVEYAIDGSEMAAKGLMVVGFVAFYLKAGVGLLEAGLAAEKTYLDRLNKTTFAIEAGTYGMKEEAPSSPSAPAPWASRREQHNASVISDNTSLVLAAEHKREDETEEIEKRFLKIEFHKIYLHNRTKLIDYIYDLGLKEPAFSDHYDGVQGISPKTNKAKLTSLAQNWANVLTQNPDFIPLPYVTSPAYEKKRFKHSPNKEEVDNEIEKFHKAEPKCPLFEEVFRQERDRYVIQALAKTHPEGN